MSEHQESGAAGYTDTQPSNIVTDGEPGTSGGRGAQVTESEARQVAEQARESEWALPSFGKQLFLGDFQLGLISPHPRPAEEASRRGEEF